MKNKYFIVMYKNHHEIGWHNYRTESILKALIRFIKLLKKYEIVDLLKDDLFLKESEK